MFYVILIEVSDDPKTEKETNNLATYDLQKIGVNISVNLLKGLNYIPNAYIAYRIILKKTL